MATRQQTKKESEVKRASKCFHGLTYYRENREWCVFCPGFLDEIKNTRIPGNLEEHD